MSSASDGKSGHLMAALEGGNPQEIIRAMLKHDFTLIRDGDEDMSEDDFGGLILEVEGFPALVAFTSAECAGNYVATEPELIGEDGTVPGFVVEGKSILDNLPEGYGLLLNPETDEQCHVLSPDFIEELKELARGL